jgi:hypothetical protein
LTRFRLILLAAVALFAAGMVSACGGDDGEDAQAVLDETFNNDEQVTSGVLDLNFEATAEGAQGGNANLTLSGPFQGEEGDPAALPQLDWTASASAEGAGQSFSFDGGLIVSEDNAFVEYQGETYEVGKELFNQFKQAAEQSAAQAEETQEEGGSIGDTVRASCEQSVEQAGGDTSACDIDFSSWLTDLESEGTEDIEGTETDHISGSLNVEQVFSDLVGLSAATGEAEVPEEQLDQASEVVSDASFDLYSGVDDRILRGLDFNLGLDPSALPGAEAVGIDGADVSFSLRLSGVNEPQTIEAPSGARPLDDLLGQFGLGGLPLGGLGGGLGSDLGGGGGGGLYDFDGPGGVTPGGGGGGGGGSQDAYLDCISEAQTPDEINACVEQL